MVNRVTRNRCTLTYIIVVLAENNLENPVFLKILNKISFLDLDIFDQLNYLNFEIVDFAWRQVS